MIERGLKTVVAALFSALLVGWLLTTGQFTSSLDVATDGNCSFRHSGEIILVTNKAVMDQVGQAPAFEPACEDDAGESRDCTAEEVADARSKFDAEQKARADREAKES